MEVTYVYLITRGYAAGDLSQVYPIARGAPPLLIAVWSALFLAERLPVLGYAGIALLVFGVYLASLPTLGDFWTPLTALTHRPAQWALLAAICVSIYSVIDKVNIAFSSPLVYNTWVYAGISLGYAPFAWSQQNRASTQKEWRVNWRRILIGSVATIGSYVLALIGMQMTAASYVGAVRATSVVIGALFGWLLLKEKFGPVRVFAAVTMVLGLLLVAMAR
jgi:drug/metabolite transporter (DMT)-like permease